LIWDGKVKSTWNSPVSSRLPVLAQGIEVFIRRGVAFVLAEKLQARHSAYRAVEVHDFACDFENERAFGDDCRRVLAKLA
jgi:hypothetical protein